MQGSDRAHLPCTLSGMSTQIPQDGGLEYGLTLEIERYTEELAVIDELLDLDGKDILELGCGNGQITRDIASAGSHRRVLALEVDEVQHALNLTADKPDNVRFDLGVAEDIPVDDGSQDVVFLFKSLHHVPTESMDRALSEVARVLRPGGFACISEPLYRGGFNEILRIFHDEKHVRRAAFEAIERALAGDDLELVSQTFFRAPLHYANWEEFEQLVVGASHSQHELSDEVLAQVRSTFARFADDTGAHFREPFRIDLLRRRAAPAR